MSGWARSSSPPETIGEAPPILWITIGVEVEDSGKNISFRFLAGLFMSSQFDSKLWFLLSFQLRIPPWKIMNWSVDYDQNSWRNSFELNLDSGTGLGFRDRFRIRGRFACRDRFKGFGENMLESWNRIMVPKTFSAEDSTLKNRYSKHSFENHRQIRLYSECFSGF